jgi:hypothetical protein
MTLVNCMYRSFDTRELLRRGSYETGQTLFVQDLAFDQASNFLDSFAGLLEAYHSRHIVDFPHGSEHIAGVFPSV